MDELIWFGWAAAAIISYAILTVVLAYFAQPMRLEMADIGKKLLCSDDLTEKERAAISAMLDDAFDRVVMIKATWHFPAVLAGYIRTHVLNSAKEDEKTPWERDGVSDETKHLFLQFVSHHMKSTAASNPPFAAILMIEMLFGSLVVGSFATARSLVELAIANSDQSIAASRLKHAHGAG